MTLVELIDKAIHDIKVYRNPDHGLFGGDTITFEKRHVYSIMKRPLV
jgi:hypothetical protein